jgi:SNF2 family DNA or RNA helicase
MIVDESIINEVYESAGSARLQRAKDYVEKRKIRIEEIDYSNRYNFRVTGKVFGSEVYETSIEVKNGEIEDLTCECQDYYSHYGACKHIVATLIYFNEKTDYRDLINGVKKQSSHVNNEMRYRGFNQLLNMLFNDDFKNIDEEKNEILKKKVKIEPYLEYDRQENSLKVEFKIGNERMYKIKNLVDFYDNVRGKFKYKYGVKLEFVHTIDAFEEESKPLLEFILKNAEIIKNVNSDLNSNYRYYGKILSDSNIILSPTALDDFFEVMENKNVPTQMEYFEENIQFINSNPDIKFKLERLNKDEYKLFANDDLRKIRIFEGKKYSYLLDKDKLYRCSNDYENTILKVVKAFRENFLEEIIFSKEQISNLYSIVMPKIEKVTEISKEANEEIIKYKPNKLATKIYLDFDENDNIIADLKFCYGDAEFNPLDDSDRINVPRNIIDERKTMDIIGRTGFMEYKEKKCLIMPEEEKIYEFLSNKIDYYMQKFEVMVTDNFKEKQIKQPKIGQIGVKVENNLLSIDLSKLNIDADELKDIMSKYTLKKKYHKLKNGAFLNLEENKDLEFIDKLVTGMDIDYKDLEKGNVKLPVHRSLYLNQLLKGINNTEIIKNAEYKEIVRGIDKENIEEEIVVPKSLENVLRYYQKTGYKWLKVLDNYKFGGILADDMGLGKTLQMLSIIVAYVENCSLKENAKDISKNEDKRDNRKRASLVVCPSSLSLNWQNESKKFANKLNTLVIRGTAQERYEQISSIDDYDLVITSYDLLKRDIEKYKEKNYDFRYIIADEAQYLKNSNTQNAKAIKEIKADTRYALTGTPIENSLAELWSIFDFIMPGYLFTYKKFKTNFETPIVKENSQRTMEKLKMLIEPFVLRRTKKEVLTELPEKTITVLNNQMNEKQEQIYLSYLASVKEDVADTISQRGFEKSHIQILAALTRLRQICCHPSLFIKNYDGESSKLEQCIEVITEAIEAGHKILLFSGYTSMFEIIEKELKKKSINYFKLTGSTKVDERIKLVDEFNSNDDIKVFLISLKAGGTGLNLTGADMVIHYDPWWNASAENQATDRAYRIGQKKNVQVYKLITKNSIEEKIYELQQKKSELIDNMLSTKTSFISKLSKEEIMKLFE